MTFKQAVPTKYSIRASIGRLGAFSLSRTFRHGQGPSGRRCLRVSRVVPPEYSSDVKFDLSDSSALKISTPGSSNRVYWNGAMEKYGQSIGLGRKILQVLTIRSSAEVPTRPSWCSDDAVLRARVWIGSAPCSMARRPSSPDSPSPAPDEYGFDGSSPRTPEALA